MKVLMKTTTIPFVIEEVIRLKGEIFLLLNASPSQEQS